jgi:hypothetical protein
LDQLTFKNGYSDRGARVFLKVYDTTIGFAGLVESDKIPLGAQEDDGEVRDVGEGEDDFTPDPPPPPPPPPAGQRGVPIMEGERVVFTEESNPQRYIKLIASGPIDDGMLEALEDFVKRQRKRSNSDDALRRDRERFENDLASFEAAGLGNSTSADTIRRWIVEVDQILNRPR